MEVSVAEGVSPYILTVNTPTWVQGNNNNNGIKTTTYTHTLTGGTFTGAMRLVKQGDGVLNLPEGTHTYTGETNVWAGTVNFNGTLENSPVWLNRFAKLNTNGTFKGGITMDYASELRPGNENSL
jgi:autotransporter-associated beta strand protein